jgi:hypothetical protein
VTIEREYRNLPPNPVSVRITGIRPLEASDTLRVVIADLPGKVLCSANGRLSADGSTDWSESFDNLNQRTSYSAVQLHMVRVPRDGVRITVRVESSGLISVSDLRLELRWGEQ